MYQLQHSPGRTVLAQGNEYLFFSGYSYLGMSHVPEFTEAVKEGIDQYGVSHPSSRISNTQLAIYETFENILSLITGAEQTVTFSSGYLAGRAVIELLSKNDAPIYLAPNTHPAVAYGIPLAAADWKSQFIKNINQSKHADRFVLVMDAVNPLTASVANFSFLHDIDPGKRVTCVVDDSHGIGLLGPVGEGINHLVPKLPNVEVVTTCSLSKAFHINGGAVSCNSKTANLLRKSPLYTASTPMAPALVYAFIQCQPLYLLQLKKLQENIANFKELTANIAGLLSYPHLPMVVLKPAWDQTRFDAHKIIISSFAYPDPTGKMVNRVVLNALHTKPDLFKLSSVLSNLDQSEY